MKKLTAILVCAAVLLLPSCVQSNIGLRIREAGELHTGVTILHPVDGKVYQTPAQRRENEKAYVLAPEMSYRVRSPFITLHTIKHSYPQPERYDFRPTGQSRPVLVACRNWEPSQWLKAVDVLPPDARAYPARGSWGGEPSTCSPSHEPPTEPAWWRYAAAAPFDFAIDPAISFTLTVTAQAALLLTWPFDYFGYSLDPYTD